MKKIIASVLCFTMCAAMFAGCNNGSSDEKSTDGTGAAETETAAEGDTTVSQTETVEVGTGEITLNVYAMSAEVPGMITEYKELVTQANRVEVEHNLGINPFILYWRETNGVISDGGYWTFQPGYPLQNYSYSDTDKCGFYCGQSSGQDKWHIRIYANV